MIFEASPLPPPTACRKVERMRRIASWPVSFCLLSILSPQPAAAGSAESSLFIVAASDGYGVEDCLGGEGGCGQVVADAWCEAHGHGAAVAFGRTDDVTGAIADHSEPKLAGGAYFINCSK
jgi:hypothetical protein